LSFGFLVAAAMFSGALIEHGLLSGHAAGLARFHPVISQIPVPTRLPLRGSMDTHAPLLLPSEAPQAPHKAPVHKHGSAMQFAGVSLLDRSGSAG
jgi:hypothetical protein